MKFCPECGFRVPDSSRFCPECGTSLPVVVIKATETLQNSCVDGFDVIDKNADVEVYEPIATFVNKAPVICDFENQEFDLVFTGLDQLEELITEMVKRYNTSPLYHELAKEYNHDLEKYTVTAQLMLQQGKYLAPCNNIFTKARKFLVNAVNGLTIYNDIYGKQIGLFTFLIKIIDIINAGNYNKAYLYENLPQQNGAQKESNPKPQRSQEKPQSKPNNNALDFKYEIMALESVLDKQKPPLNINEYDPAIDYEAELNKLVGLNSKKEHIQKFMDNFRLQMIRRTEHPELKSNISFNCIFKGKPGTGKTTMARLIAGLLRQKGIITGGHCIEVNALSLVSGLVGFSSTITKLAAYKAMDGVLFIDNAYSLIDNFESSKNIINTLTPIMENHPDRLLVIIAGCDDKIDELLHASNICFSSRFKSVLKFEDYTSDEMTEIFLSMAKSEFYIIGEEETGRIRVLFEYIYNVRHLLPTYANARTVRSVFDQVKQRISKRILKSSICDHDTITIDDVTLTQDEIKTALRLF